MRSPKALDCCGSYPQLLGWILLEREFLVFADREVGAEFCVRAGNDPSSPGPPADCLSF